MREAFTVIHRLRPITPTSPTVSKELVCALPFNPDGESSKDCLSTVPLGKAAILVVLKHTRLQAESLSSITHHQTLSETSSIDSCKLGTAIILVHNNMVANNIDRRSSTSIQKVLKVLTKNHFM